MAGEKIVTMHGAGNRTDNASTAPVDQPVSVLAPPGLVSVLVPCCGQLEYTKLCVPSVLHHRRSPYELIFLDVGSLDGTAEYLAGVKAAAPVRVEIVRTATELAALAVRRRAVSWPRATGRAPRASRRCRA
jgi:hypothetical protein